MSTALAPEPAAAPHTPLEHDRRPGVNAAMSALVLAVQRPHPRQVRTRRDPPRHHTPARLLTHPTPPRRRDPL
jgi:hypothetical protein